jgi:hypothetical protein
MNANSVANDNVQTEAIKANAIHRTIKQREVVLSLPPQSWGNDDGASEIVSLRAASNRCTTAARAMTDPKIKARLLTRAKELALEAEALSRINAPAQSAGPATRR